ncbi:hypothetical protein EON64_02535 [archaeon]|nr:MAG: hypothetical protein EON64_02535 [archaeon]
MGNFCIGSKIYLDPTFKPYKSQFEALKFKPTEVVRLKRIFDSIDIDHSGSIGLKELLTHLDIESNNKFSKRVFSIFDEDGSGQVDFREFVLSIWNYCTLSQATLALFAFDLYDADRTGFLSPVEIEGILKDLYGSEAVSTNLQAKM